MKMSTGRTGRHPRTPTVVMLSVCGNHWQLLTIKHLWCQSKYHSSVNRFQMFVLGETQKKKNCVWGKSLATASTILVDAQRDTYKLRLHSQLQSPSGGFFFQFRQLNPQEKETSIKADMQIHAERCAELCSALR